jgi:hypothetical protein
VIQYWGRDWIVTISAYYLKEKLMKTRLHAVALAAGVACASASAFAGDTAHATQAGTNNVFSVQQIANSGNNSATIRQGLSGPADGNSANISQRTVSGSVAVVGQDGIDNLGTLDQRNTNASQVTISQQSFGSGSTGAVEQAGTSLSITNLQQVGDGNSATLSQKQTVGSQTMLLQQGDANTARLTVVGADRSRVNVNQLGTGNYSTVNQHQGSNLVLNASSLGQDHTLLVDQSGVDLLAQTEQLGAGNSLSVIQKGDGGAGGLNRAIIQQTGNANLADVTQRGAGFTADLTQSGSGNMGTIQQRF